MKKAFHRPAAPAAPDVTPADYERHRPEQTTPYRLVQQRAATFFAQAEDAAGADLPHFVSDEFDAFLKCGILAHGFLRLRCGDCGHEKLVAFSCKRRGFCPSCGGPAHGADGGIPGGAAGARIASLACQWPGALGGLTLPNHDSSGDQATRQHGDSATRTAGGSAASESSRN